MAEQSPQPNTRSLSFETEIAAPQEAVWKALRDAEELTRWFPLDAGEAPDGTLWMAWRDEFRWESRIEISEPPHHLRMVAQESLAGEQAAGEAAARERTTTTSKPTATDFYLESRGGKTVLRLVHSGFSTDAEWDALYDGTRRGWNFQLWSLRHYLENHRGRSREVAYVRTFLKTLSQQEAWQRLFGPNILVHQGPSENLKPGERYAFRTAAGDDFKGVVHAFNPPIEFYATVENLNNGIWEIHLDALFGYRDINFQLSAYGIPQERVEGIESRTRKLLQRVEAK